MVTQTSLAVIPEIYRCTEGPGLWRPVLDQICKRTGVRNAVAQLFRIEDFRLQEVWGERDSVSTNNAAAHDALVNNRDNPRLDLRIRRPPRDIISTDNNRFAPDNPQLADFQTRLASLGMRGGTGLNVKLGENRYFSLILHRSIGDEDELDFKDQCFLREIAPHVERTLAITERLNVAEADTRSITGVLDALRVGILFCDRSGQVRFTNRAAETILERSRSISNNRGKIYLSDPNDGRIFNAFISKPAAECGDLVTIGERQNDVVHVARLVVNRNLSGMGAGADWGEAGVALMLLDTTRDAPASALSIGRLFCLTPAEARLAAAVCGGQSVADYAQSREISEGTARVQLKQVLAKTGSRRQSDLVRQVCLSVAAQIGKRPDVEDARPR